MSKRTMATAAAVASLAAMGLGAASASALTVPNGTTLTGTNTGGKIALGSIISCNSTLSGTVTSGGNAPGTGGAGSITGGSFTGCTTFTSATPNFSTPWNLSVSSTGVASVTGIRVAITTPLGTCQYGGSLGGTYSGTTGDLTLSGSLTRTSGSCGGGATEAVSGTYAIRAPGGVIVGL